MDTKHFKGFSIVNGTTRIDVNLSRFEQKYKDAQFWLDSQVMTDMVPYMPHQTGTFIQLTRARSAAMAGTGQVCAGAPPYGRFLYEGKGMVDEITGSPWARKGAKKVLVGEFGGQTRAKENLTFSNKSATPHWFETAKKRHGKSWISGVKKRAGGK